MFESTATTSAAADDPKRNKHKQPPLAVTYAKIHVEVPVPGSDDRVITVIENSSVNRTLAFSKDNSSDESSECIEVSVAHEALIRVLERILFVTAEANGGNLASEGDEDNNLSG
ncbi:hypothetical protein L1987_32251 [Smallanthus sonchifolius]|uniref:Uncharacterized protein n=1 Tax=Smallanthus sonchifolius TaxID=185202 RepID=A0ACB9I8J5_9ASTR|nr:hypothetical protein L1987_32251 [Smallanthus sonchifolius]